MFYKLLALLIFIPAVLWAEDVAFDSLAQMEAFSIKNNLALSAKRSEVLAAQELHNVRGGFGDLMLGFETMENSFNRYFVSQTIPFFGKINDLEAVADYEAKMAQAEYRALENKTILDLRTQYYEWAATHASMTIYAETVGMLTQWVRYADLQYQIGQGPVAAGLRMRTELYHWQALQIGAQTDLKNIQDQLKLSLGLALDDTIAHTPAFPQTLNIKPEFKDLLNQLEAQNPELQIAQAQLKIAQKEKDYLSKVYGPDINVMYSRYQNNMPPDQNSFQFQIGVPWWNARNDASVRRAELLVQTAEGNYRNRLLEQSILLRKSWNDLEKYTQYYQIHREALPFAKQTLDSILRTYRSEVPNPNSADMGASPVKTSYMELIDAYRTLLETQLDLLMHQKDYWVSWAQIESLFMSVIPAKAGIPN
jgi:cobalt-zinc-cadmium efflux system outer membrane protein